MKKTIYSFMAFFMISLGMSLTSCNSCGRNNENLPTGDSITADSTQIDSVQKIVTLNVERTIAQDRQEVYNKLKGKDYRWFETSINLAYFMDSEDASPEIEGITNIFQYTNKKEDESYDVQVIESIWQKDGKHFFVYPPGFYVGDFDLSEEEIKITFDEAFQKLRESNTIKPHSRKCVLRREIGPKPNVHPQYIFGNKQHQVYVDATTGEVTEVNPAYTGKPLGEWPK